jgi:Domain of unknown function (DUF4145)
MNRSLWTESLTETTCPAWPCPVCSKGTVALTPKSLTHKETVESARARDHDAWDPDWIRYVFTAWAECKHPSCKQGFAIAGTGGVGQYYGEDGPDWEDYFNPQICEPMPSMISLPMKSPDDVAQELRAAFGLFWSNHSSCAGRIRVALECLMSHIGVPKRKKNAQGKLYDLSLHARIDEIASGSPATGQQLIALKWLGNSGSHDSEVSSDDLLDAFEILEHALGEIIDQRSARVAALAKKMTKKHGRKKR